jgi:hypothetical protein
VSTLLNTLVTIPRVLSSVRPPELGRMEQEYERRVERDLQRDRPKLLSALEEFANMRSDTDGWAHFRRRWPNFFPETEYDNVAGNSRPSIADYPYWLGQIWTSGETEPCLPILLGIDPNPVQTEGTPEEAWFSGLRSISPQRFHADWEYGIFRYQGGCDFQRALYLLFRESWRARICEKCGAKFIARRAAQRYCTRECSQDMQRELKRKWWAEQGKTWRRKRKSSKSTRGKEDQHGTRKTR